MSKPDNRGSLMNLRPNLTKVAPIVATEEMENAILGKQTEIADPGESMALDHGVRTEGRKDVRTEMPAARRDVTGNSKQNGGQREGIVLLNAKIPVSLHTRLKRTSQFNNVSMTDILLRGIESELESGRYRAPPMSWGAEK